MSIEPSSTRRAPELLAPAGNWECIHAAIENGADAVYFGLDAGFNARARAVNFALDDLPELMRLLHRRGLVGYVTLNTLIFTDELPQFETHVRALATAGVDAVLVQDLGAVRLIHEVCPELSVHASTQMTMVSAETIQAIEELRVDRVVLARELSIREIQKITSATRMPIETFVHGALCVAYSGQCLTSESLGGRSANRGQCAQACRLTYDLLCDGVHRDLGDNRYLLSPQDLAAYEHVPQLIEAGVSSLKIEGRLKTPEYVANIVSHYRQAIDSAMQGQSLRWSQQSRREMELSFSRGFTPGWLEGCDHKRLVPGKSSAKKGVSVGRVIKLQGSRLSVDLTVPLVKGDGIVLQGNRALGQELGGRIFQVFVDNRTTDAPAQGRVELAFQNGFFQGIADPRSLIGKEIWQTDDPRLSKKLRASFSSEQYRRKIPLTIVCKIAVDQPMELTVSWPAGWDPDSPSRSIGVPTEFCPKSAQKHPIHLDQLHAQLGRLGSTPYQLVEVRASIDGNPMVPLSVLGELRKKMVSLLDAERTKLPVRTIACTEVAKRMLDAIGAEPVDQQNHGVELSVLCRSMVQLEQVLSAGERRIYAEFHDIREYRQAVALAHRHAAKLHLCTLRIHKPGESGLFKALAKQGADGWLVRNLAALDYALANGIEAVGDFSLNVTNPLTAQWLIERGLQRITPSYDLNRDQLTELVSALPPRWLEVVIHQHIPMFHMEHCVYCTVLSPGTNKSNCGRPCDRHDVKLRDRLGVEHVLHADVGCRNTLYNGVAQSGAEAVERLVRLGVRQFRIELLRDASADETLRLLKLYRELIDGKIDGATVWRSLKAENRVGVTRGTLEHPRNPLAIL